MVAPVVAAALISGAAALGGGLLGKSSAQQQASMSRKEAALNREFQERMSSTAYQRSAADLEKAGLNRVLALGSPASSPGGNMAPMPDMAGAVSSGMHAGSAVAGNAINAMSQWSAASSAHSQARMAKNEADLSDQQKVLETMKYEAMLEAAKKVKSGGESLFDKVSQQGVGGLLDKASSSAKSLSNDIGYGLEMLQDKIEKEWEELKAKDRARRGTKPLTLYITKGNDK